MTPRVRILVFANIGVFFLQQTSDFVLQAFTFVPALIVLRPWSIVTYMFLHGGLMHIGFNMLALYFFGPQVEGRLGARHFTILYFVSGVTGAALSAALAPRSPIIGASAGVFGVMLAFAYYWPRAVIMIWAIIPVEAWLLVAITTVFAMVSGVMGSVTGVADFAHLGGYAGAFLYLKLIERRRHEFRRQAEGWGVGAPKPRRRAPPDAGVLPIRRKSRERPRIDMTNVHELNREELNRILDKIGEHGEGSLTGPERMFLSNFVPPDDRVPPPT